MIMAQEERTGVTRGFTVEAQEVTRTPVLDVDTGGRYRLVPFAPVGVTVEPYRVHAYNVHCGPQSHRESYAVGTTVAGAHVAWHVDCYAWEDFNGYKVRTEPRGEYIVAVYVKGPANEIQRIERTSRAYARRHLAFAPGCSPGPVGGGGEFRDAGATYISQDTHTVKHLPPRTD